jgi:hypothetical protein
MTEGFDRYDRDEHEAGGGSFMMGLLTGTVLGAGLGMLFAPKAGSELRNQLGEQANSLGRAAGDQYRRASDAASGMVEQVSGGRTGEEGRPSSEPFASGSSYSGGSTYTGGAAGGFGTEGGRGSSS